MTFILHFSGLYHIGGVSYSSASDGDFVGVNFYSPRPIRPIFPSHPLSPLALLTPYPNPQKKTNLKIYRVCEPVVSDLEGVKPYQNVIKLSW